MVHNPTVPLVPMTPDAVLNTLAPPAGHEGPYHRNGGRVHEHRSIPAPLANTDPPCPHCSQTPIGARTIRRHRSTVPAPLADTDR